MTATRRLLEEVRGWLGAGAGIVAAVVGLLALFPAGRWRSVALLAIFCSVAVAGCTFVIRARAPASSLLVPGAPDSQRPRFSGRARRLSMWGIVATVLVFGAGAILILRAEGVRDERHDAASLAAPATMATTAQTTTSVATVPSTIGTTVAASSVTTGSGPGGSVASGEQATSTTTSPSSSPPDGLRIDDVRVGGTADHAVYDIVFRTSDDAVVDEIVVNQAWVVREACGGASSYELSLEPEVRLVVDDSGTTSIQLEQLTATDDVVVPTDGYVRDVAAGCTYQAGVRLRPQISAPSGDFQEVRVNVPYDFVISDVTHDLLPGHVASSELVPGQTYPVLVDLRDWTTLGGNTAFALEIVITTVDGACDSYKVDLDARPFEPLSEDKESEMRDYSWDESPVFIDCRA